MLEIKLNGKYEYLRFTNVDRLFLHCVRFDLMLEFNLITKLQDLGPNWRIFWYGLTVSSLLKCKYKFSRVYKSCIIFCRWPNLSTITVFINLRGNYIFIAIKRWIIRQHFCILVRRKRGFYRCLSYLDLAEEKDPRIICKH